MNGSQSRGRNEKKVNSGREWRGRKTLFFLSFQALPACPSFTTGMNVKILDWGKVVAIERGPRDLELLVNLKEKNIYVHFIFVLCKLHRKPSVFILQRTKQYCCI